MTALIFTHVQKGHRLRGSLAQKDAHRGQRTGSLWFSLSPAPTAPRGHRVSLPNCRCGHTERDGAQPAPSLKAPAWQWITHPPAPGQPCSHPVKGRDSLHPSRASLHRKSPQVLLEKLPAASTHLHRGATGHLGLCRPPWKGQSLHRRPRLWMLPCQTVYSQLLFRAVGALVKVGETGGPRGVCGWGWTGIVSPPSPAL